MALQNPSLIDDFFLKLTGLQASKDGRAFEIISTAVLSILREEKAKHDVLLKGTDGTNYQIDGLLADKEMVEAKDYTVKKKKVGRGDLQKQQGALTALPDIEHGYITSATEFTRDATKYAIGTETNERQTEINTVEVRPSTPQDRKGRIETIRVEMHITDYEYDEGIYNVIFKKGEMQRLHNDMLKSGHTDVRLQIVEFYDKNGRVVANMMEVSKEQMKGVEEKDGFISGRLNIDAYIRCGNDLYGIDGIDYRIPVVNVVESFEVNKEGEPVVYVKCDAKGVNKLINDKELKDKIREITKGKQI